MYKYYFKESQTWTDNWGAEDLRVPNYTIPLWNIWNMNVLDQMLFTASEVNVWDSLFRFPKFCRLSQILSKSSRGISTVNEDNITAIWLAMNPISIRILTHTRRITDPFSSSEKSGRTHPFWIFVDFLYAFLGCRLTPDQLLLLGLLLFFFQDSHLVRPCHRSSEN